MTLGLGVYSFGNTPRTPDGWIEPTVQGQPEPQHPAPTISVTAGGAPDRAGSPAAASSSSTGSGPSGWTIAGVALCGVGLLLALATLAAALRGSRRTMAETVDRTPAASTR